MVRTEELKSPKRSSSPSTARKSILDANARYRPSGTNKRSPVKKEFVV